MISSFLLPLWYLQTSLTPKHILFCYLCQTSCDTISTTKTTKLVHNISMIIHVQFLFNQICSFQEKKSFTFSLKNKMLTITQWTCMSSLFSINNIITGMFSLPWVKGEIGENVLQRPPATTYVQEARNFPGNYWIANWKKLWLNCIKHIYFVTWRIQICSSKRTRLFSISSNNDGLITSR